ncbi:MAG: hypothetical protein AABY22_00945 [Nanoarchaeota archaeon]
MNYPIEVPQVKDARDSRTENPFYERRKETISPSNERESLTAEPCMMEEIVKNAVFSEETGGD